MPPDRVPDAERRSGELLAAQPGRAAELLFGGRIYLTLLTFNKPLTPIRMAVDRAVYREIEAA